MTLRSDPYFPLLLSRLKDERVPINAMDIQGLNWFNFPNPSAFRSALISFPHICVLCLGSITCSRNDMRCLVASLPKLIRLNLKGCKLQEWDGTVAATIPRGPTLESFSIEVVDGDYDAWDLFTSPESPASLKALKRIMIEGDGARVVNDRTIVDRIQALLDLPEFTLEDFDIAYINLDEGLQPLHIEDVQEISITITLSDDFDQMNRCVQWWTTTFLALPSQNMLSFITVEITVDQHRVQGGSIPPCDTHFWKALDKALCRPEINLDGLHFWVHAKPSPNYIPTYDYRGVMHWLYRYCLPRCAAKYESNFELHDEYDELVDLLHI